MLNYNIQYDISQAIFFVFKNNSEQAMLKVYHSENARNNCKKIFFYNKFLSWNRGNFILACLYIVFTKNPSSITSFYEKLNEIDITNIEYIEFEDSIKNNGKHIKNNVDYILSTIGGNPDIDDMFKMYTKHEIKFYVLWWYIVYSKTLDMDTICKASRIKEINLKKIKNMLLYIKFDEHNIRYIKNLFSANSLLS